MYVYCGKGGVAGIAADNGELLWDTDEWQIAMATCPSPVVVGEGRIFFCGGYNSGSLMLQLQQEQGRIVPQTVFRLAARQFGSEQQTPVLWQQHLYAVRQKDQQLVCLDLDGKELWNSGRDKFGSGPYLIADGLIYVLDDDGVLSIAEAAPTAYRRLARAQVIEDGSSSWGPMALVAGRLIVRDTFAHGMHRRGGALIMKRSKLLLIAGSLVGAAMLIVVAIVDRPHCAVEHRGKVRRSAATSGDATAQADEEAALKAAEPIDPAMIGYHEAGSFPVAFREPRALAVDADAQIYVGGDRAVIRYSGDGKKLAEIALQGEPRCLAVGGPDMCIPADCTWGWRTTLRFTTPRARGSRFGDPAARRQSSLRSPRPKMKSGLPTPAIASSGGSMPRGNSCKPVGRPDPSQNRPGFLVTSHYFDLAAGTDDLVYVVNPRLLRVEGFTQNGEYETAWGKGSPAVADFFGCCNPAQLAVLPDGSFVTAEKGMPRVKIYSRRRKFQTVVAGPRS